MTREDGYEHPSLFGQQFPGQPQDYPSPMQACDGPPHDDSIAQSPFRIDEGFSEETRSLPGDESDLHSHSTAAVVGGCDDWSNQPASVRRWLLTQPMGWRSAMARELLLSLPNALLADLVVEANERLHFDPVRCLPQEIIANIFEYLDADALVNASLVSKIWRARAAEPRLWRRLFSLEGWIHNQESVRSFEQRSRSRMENLWSSRKGRPRPRGMTPDGSDLKRVRHGEGKQREGHPRSRLWVENASIGVPATSTGKRGSLKTETPDAGGLPVDEEMHDATDSFIADADEMESGEAPRLNTPLSPPRSVLKPSHLGDTPAERLQPNWQYLYNQRRRLEQNWTAGRFTNFRLPHPDYRGEAHQQCVYTLQFSSKYVVSGSRDKTVRIWDLRTQRLKIPPLVGHEGSVLCLQFDERPHEDVIISGGSDSDVIVWKFSTGSIITRLRLAHTESVLNLRFDSRYLVTCSKDKTIKLWSRKELRPTDPEYPRYRESRNVRYPDYIVNAQDLNGGVPAPLSAYSLLMTFDEHNAAVNAIQIFGDQIVSASGDRKIMLWDIPMARLVRTFAGHSKGIACVQYDGRRIVSGSSDNSVRIFDCATSAEVAVLEGHRDLVRTVQADFGEIPGAEELDEKEARENDRRILEEKRQELRGSPAPSSRSNEHFVFGAKLPPGGGGNRWSKIVSGSYDETVIIWRKDKDNRWVVAKELRQDDAMRATAPLAHSHPAYSWPQAGLVGSMPRATPVSASQLLQQAQAGISTNLPPEMRAQLLRQQNRMRNWHAAQGWMSTGSSSQQRQGNTAPASSSASIDGSAQTPQQQPTQQPSASSSSGALAAGDDEETNRQSSLPQQAQRQAQAQPLPPAHHHPNHPHYQYSAQAGPNPLAPTHQHAQTPNAANAQGGTHHNQLHAHAAGQRAAMAAQDGGMSRVFKLQFDVRRVICCSQQAVIVGWDFANGDADIEEACQFFEEGDGFGAAVEEESPQEPTEREMDTNT